MHGLREFSFKPANTCVTTVMLDSQKRPKCQSDVNPLIPKVSGSQIPIGICCIDIAEKHLTLRTWLKRLRRKSICFSKSVLMHEGVIGLFINREEFGLAI